MTEFFNYDQLTWPEVAELQRDTPLVLALGIGYELKRLAESYPIPPALDFCRPSLSAGVAVVWKFRRPFSEHISTI